MPHRIVMANPRSVRHGLLRLTAGLALAGATVAPAALAHPEAAAAAPTTPAPLTVLSGNGAAGRGDIFLTPTGDTNTYANGAEITDRHGQELWFHAAPTGDTDADFRAQTYHHRPVLTFWEGTGLGGLSDGTDYILNDHYQPVATVHAGNGLTTDGHEFLITRSNTALVLSYETATADLSSIGGAPNQTVIDGIVQEIDIATGRVLFSWNSADHVPYSQSEQPLPASPSTPWDWFHVNAVHLDTDGNLLIDARDTWTIYKVDRHSGSVIWQLGGKASSFTLQAAPGQTLNDAGDIFAWQHDPQAIGHDQYTVFDNESAGTSNQGTNPSSEFNLSRVARLQLDERARTATLVQSYNQPEGLLASSQGNGQPLPGGGSFVGWGNLNYVSEFDRAGDLRFNAAFPSGVNTYRAYLLPWPRHHGDGHPHHQDARGDGAGHSSRRGLSSPRTRTGR
jgi:hypothetical protein